MSPQGVAPDVVDGIPVDVYDGTFVGKFDIDDEWGRRVQYDDIVCMLITTVVSGVSGATDKNGHMKRSVKFQVQGVHEVDQNAINTIVANMTAAVASPQVP